MSIAYHSMNYSPPIVIGKKTPHQVWSCKPVYCSNKKLESTFMKCIFLGYNPKVRGYKLWYPETKKVIINRYILFDCTAMLHVTLTTKSNDVDQDERSSK